MKSPEVPLLVMFAYHYPPENAIGGVRPFRFAKYLSRLGVRVHVLTAADVKSRPDLNAETVEDAFVARPREGFGWQIERAIRKLLLPGASGNQWAVGAYRAACNFLDRQSDVAPAVVYSTYPPLGTTLAGYWLAKRRHIPWILDFRDPMGDNPGDKHLHSHQRAIYRWLERRFVAAADCVIANTDAAQTRLHRKFPEMADKIYLLWNGFDPEQRLSSMAIPKRPQKVYSHVGELYEGRTIAPLLLSIARLIEGGRLSPLAVLIQLIGPIGSTSIPGPEFMAAAVQQGWLKIHSQNLPQAEAQRVMQESDGLLLIQPHSQLQVPGKLFEYVQIGRPVLAYILPDTPIERILRQSGVPCGFAYSSVDNATFDESVLKFFKLDTDAIKPSDWFEQNFNTRLHAEELYKWIDQLAVPLEEPQARLFSTTTVSR